MELVDVLDVATNTITHQLYIWPWGSGELFVHGTTTRAAAIIQHGFDQQVDDLAFRKALAAAYATAKPALAETVDFRLEPKPPADQVEREEANQIATIYQQLAKLLGTSTERYRDFDAMTATQQKAIRNAFRTVSVELLAAQGLAALGFPPETRMRSWCGHSPRGALEQRAGRWPVWKWLKEAIAGRASDASAIAAIRKALKQEQILVLAGNVCEGFYDYDLWGQDLYTRPGVSVSDHQETRVAKLIGELVDAAGLDAAVEYSVASQQPPSKEAGFLMAAVASFALAARARRRKEPFPKKPLSQKELVRELARIQREA